MKKLSNLPFYLTVTIYFLSICSNTAISQEGRYIEGFYVTQAGDTLSGIFNDNRMDDKILKFKRSEREKRWQILGPSDIVLAAGKNNFYVLTSTLTLKEESEQIFVNRYAKGDVNLYEGESALRGRVFFISTIKYPEPIPITRAGPGDFFRGYFPECKDILQKKVRYDKYKLLNAAREISTCAYPGSEVEINKSPLQLRWGIGGSIFGYTYDSDARLLRASSYHGATKVGFALNAEMTAGRRLGLGIGVSYIDRSIESDSFSFRADIDTFLPVGSPGYVGEFRISYHYRGKNVINTKLLEFPLRLHYNMTPFAKTQAILFAGVNLAFPLKVEYADGPQTPYLQTSILPQEILPPLSRGARNLPEIGWRDDFSMALFAGVGFRRPLGRSSILEVYLQYSSYKEEVILKSGRSFPSTLETSRLDLGVRYLFFGKGSSNRR